MARMLVVADDLTGAADCGVACASHGLRTVVVFGDDDGDAQADVLSVDANTRHMKPEKATAETARHVQRYIRDEGTLLYKKIDSTLRGNVAAELAAALEARRALTAEGERIVAVLAPAFPANDRTTVKGRQLIHGKPLEETGLWQYERMTARSYIPEMLDEAHLRSALVGLDLIRSGGALQEVMKTLAREADVLVCDAETDEDLRAIADASMALGRGTVWAGSAGLAYHLPPAAGLTRASAAIAEEPLARGPSLFVVGSGSSISREQTEVLTSRSDVTTMKIAPDILLAGKESQKWRAHELALEEALRAGRDVVVLPGLEPRLQSAKGPLLAAALAEMARPFAETVGALVVTGGETARAVFQAWGICRLWLVGEVEAGLPYSVTAGWSRRLPVLTKAGAFGRPETLLHCRQFLRELDRGGKTYTEKSIGVQ
ncbi:MAG: four-carbon acid sugar kinase family protein [Acidobacteriota bacterium]|nr:four-carbon acid sugar kinase family protein [Acidobacteriota bacterium]